MKNIAQNTADISFPDFLIIFQSVYGERLINKSHPPTYGYDSATTWSEKQVDDVKDGRREWHS